MSDRRSFRRRSKSSELLTEGLVQEATEGNEEIPADALRVDHEEVEAVTSAEDAARASAVAESLGLADAVELTEAELKDFPGSQVGLAGDLMSDDPFGIAKGDAPGRQAALTKPGEVTSARDQIPSLADASTWGAAGESSGSDEGGPSTTSTVYQGANPLLADGAGDQASGTAPSDDPAPQPKPADPPAPAPEPKPADPPSDDSGKGIWRSIIEAVTPRWREPAGNATVGVRGTPNPDDPSGVSGPVSQGAQELIEMAPRTYDPRPDEPKDIAPVDPGGGEFGTTAVSTSMPRVMEGTPTERIDPYVNPDPEGGGEGDGPPMPIGSDEPVRTDQIGSLIGGDPIPGDTPVSEDEPLSEDAPPGSPDEGGTFD